jgi:hypothetical protein
LASGLDMSSCIRICKFEGKPGASPVNKTRTGCSVY